VNVLYKFVRVLLPIVAIGPAFAQKGYEADVIVISDTSGSMQENDPRNSVVLVTRLFADIVPGKLAAVRLEDVNREGPRFGAAETGERSPCGPDRPGEICRTMKYPPGAEDRIVQQLVLAAVRQGRGDAAFKSNVKELLHPEAPYTSYNLGLRTIAQIFKNNASPPTIPKFVVWLSDGAGDSKDWNVAKPEWRGLIDSGAQILPLVFRSGGPNKLSELSLQPDLVDGSPQGIIAAFANAFRKIVQAPYRVDGRVAQNPTFSIKPRMEQVWVVIYGDASLGNASISNGGQSVQADYAADSYNGYAYRVVYMNNPAAGNWTISAVGGANASYAVIQRSTITPKINVPPEVSPGTPFKLDISLQTGGVDLGASDLPDGVQVEAKVDGETVKLEKGADGHFTAMVTPKGAGAIQITAHAWNEYMNGTAKATVQAKGFFRYTGGPVAIDFGQLRSGETVCRPLLFSAQQEGAIPFELRTMRALPSDHEFELRAGGKRESPGGSPINLGPEETKEICLVTGRLAPASKANAENYVVLGVAGHTEKDTIVEIQTTWTVKPLTFWEKWGWLILLILAAALVFFIIYGWIKPNRFPTGLALQFAPAYEELDDQTPQPVKLWRGVGIGWYRDARACLQDNFRVTSKVKGSVAILQAGKRKAVMVRWGSRTLYREVGLNEWEAVAQNGRRTGHGETYRVGESGPYFRISLRVGS